jgi:1,4-alpha-glucan branching enzyme
MAAKNIVLVIVGHQGYVRHVTDEKAYDPENDILFESISNTYLPLLNIFKSLDADKVSFKVGLVLSPPLCSLLDDPTIQQQYIEWLNRRIALGEEEVKRCAKTEYAESANACLVQAQKDKIDFTEVYDQKLLPLFAEYAAKGYVELIATAGTYAFLPHYNDMVEILNAQIETGLYAHRHFFGSAPEGFWLPYMGYTNGLEKILRAYGISYTVLDTHGFLFSETAPKGGIFSPVRCANSLVLFARDNETPGDISDTDGYMNNPVYKDQTRDVGFDLSAAELKSFLPSGCARVPTGYSYWANGSDRSENRPVYDPAKAKAQAAEDAKSFLAAKAEKLEKASVLLKGKDVSLVCTIPACVLGQDWAEGILWLEQVFRRNDKNKMTFAKCGELMQNQFELPKVEPFPSAASGTGYGEDLLDSTNGWMLRYVRKMSERMVDLAGRFPDDTGLKARLLNLGAKELMLAQSGEWAKMLHENRFSEYVTKRFRDSISAFTAVFDSLGSNTVSTEWLTNLEHEHTIFPWMNYRIFSRKK